MSDLFGNPEDRFSQNEAQIMVPYLVTTLAPNLTLLDSRFSVFVPAVRTLQKNLNEPCYHANMSV